MTPKRKKARKIEAWEVMTDCGHILAVSSDRDLLSVDYGDCEDTSIVRLTEPRPDQAAEAAGLRKAIVAALTAMADEDPVTAATVLAAAINQPRRTTKTRSDR